MGRELDYAENHDGVILVTALHSGNGNGQAFLQGHPIEFNGVTPIFVECQVAAIEPDFNNAIQFNLYDGITDLGCIATFGTGGKPADITRSSFAGKFTSNKFTPTEGTHTFSIRIWKTGGSSFSSVYSDTPVLDGGPGYQPAYMRIMTASNDLFPLPPLPPPDPESIVLSSGTYTLDLNGELTITGGSI